LILKKEVFSALFSILLLLGIDTTLGDVNYLSGSGRFNVIFNYLNPYVHTRTTSSEFTASILIPILVSTILLLFSFVYFTRVMEID